MPALIIDTSTEKALIAISEGNELLFAEILPSGNNLSQLLLPTIAELLNKAKLDLKQLNYIAVGIGPGSYTGTRVGVAAARSLSFGLEIPLIDFCSLLAFTPKVPGPFMCAMTTQMGPIFLVEGDKNLKNILTVHIHGLVSIENFQDLIKENTYILTNDPISLQKNLASKSSHCLSYEHHPLPLIPLVHEKFQRKEFHPKGNFELIYLNSLQKY